MSFFSDIDDELTSDLSNDYTEVFAAIRRLTELLNVDSYDEMGDQHEHAATLLQSEAELSGILSQELEEDLSSDIPDSIIDTFLLSYRLEALYPDTVGEVEEAVSTIPLETFPHFKARKLDSSIRAGAFARLCEQFQVSGARLSAIDEIVSSSHRRLSSRRQLFDQVRELVIAEEGGPRSRNEIKALFDRYFPENPLRASEVEVIVTRTCLYWSIPKLEDLEKRDTSTEQEAAEAWLKHTGRFAFQYFSHFPTFSSFDARDADPTLVADLAEKLGWDESDIISGLNSTTTIERTAEIEKYLIHDTWGHMWQGDLTDLGRLYDTMESLKSPVDANEHLTLPDGNVVSPLDLMYLNARGNIRFDESLAERYVDQWIRLRIRALLAPIVAELTADCVEYKFKLDNAAREDLLPSSSLFADNPAKLDFAWVDIGYFVRSLKRTNSIYVKNKDLRENLVERVSHLLKLKYPRQFKRIDNADAFRGEVESVVDRFLEIVLLRQEMHLNQDLSFPETEGGDSNPNAFSLLFTNFLRVQFTLNRIIKGEMETKRPELANLFNILILFVVRYFENAPLRYFWNLDETLGKYGLPLLMAAERAESES